MTSAQPTFNLSRWFALTALVSITVLAVAISLLLNRFLTERMIAQEASLTQEFAQSLLAVETTIVEFVAAASERPGVPTPQAIGHLANVPDVLRTNLYDRQQRLVWSSDASLRGRTFDHNPELDRALAGAVVAKREDHGHEGGKAEHESLRGREAMFVEIYVPVRDPKTQNVLGAIEFYKKPQALARALGQLRWYIALGAVLAGALLFLALYGLVLRADTTIRTQQRQLVDQATLAALGEMSGAVAHGIRNPLASIRSSAELMLDSPPEDARDAARDIVSQADRLEAWVRELLAYTQPVESSAGAAVALSALVRRCLDDFAHEFERRRIETSEALPPGLPPVRGDSLLLAQVLRTLMSNAVEVLGTGGRIAVRGEQPSGRIVMLEIKDSGPGLSPQQLARVGQPFYTTKPRGLGVGLAMARRIVERSGGRLEIVSSPGHGTAVRLHLMAA